jgi:hypothetical protein
MDGWRATSIATDGLDISPERVAFMLILVHHPPRLPWTALRAACRAVWCGATANSGLGLDFDHARKGPET